MFAHSADLSGGGEKSTKISESRVSPAALASRLNSSRSSHKGRKYPPQRTQSAQRDSKFVQCFSIAVRLRLTRSSGDLPRPHSNEHPTYSGHHRPLDCQPGCMGTTSSQFRNQQSKCRTDVEERMPKQVSDCSTSGCAQSLQASAVPGNAY